MRLTFLYSLLLVCLCLGCAKSDKKAARRAGGKATVADTTAPAFDRYWNDLARYLGGLEPQAGSDLNGMDTTAVAVRHRLFFNNIWPNIQQQHLDKIAKWAETEMPKEHESDRTVLYPFSGADFVTVATLFPNAKNYFMYGLEREGNIPDLFGLDSTLQQANLNNLQNTLSTMLNLSFFRTSDMQRQFNAQALFNGTTPVVLAFMARTGYEVLDVRRILLLSNGKLRYLRSDNLPPQTTKDPLITGMEIKFRKSPDSPVQSLQFFSFDAQDVILKNQPYLFSYFKQFAPATSYFKSASYLMHWDTYGLIRNNILECSDVILQEDTGIALRKFGKDQWKFQLYGAYVRPIREFTGQFQNDLAALYQQQAASVKPLDFGLGYHNDLGTSNLMVARKIQSGSAGH